MVLFLAAVARSYHPGTGFTSLIGFPPAGPTEPPALQAIPHQQSAGANYDGQFYAQRALDPLLRDPTMADLADGFGQFDSDTALVAYAESLIAGQLLCERLGQNLGPFLQMLGAGHSVDQALSTVNIQPELFYAEWRRRIGMK